MTTVTAAPVKTNFMSPHEFRDPDLICQVLEIKWEGKRRGLNQEKGVKEDLEHKTKRKGKRSGKK